MKGRISVDAPAKINLVLDLLGPREDGYTEIATVFQTLELADHVALELELEEGRTPAAIRLELSGEAPCPEEENLAWRAARAFADAAGLSGEIRVRLDKELPAGAGLGGGSSDAAAVLRGLAELLPGVLDAARRRAIAASLGADVPYFLEGGLALGTGRGDEIRTLPDLPVTECALVLHGEGLSTAAVYREARKTLTPRDEAPNIRRFLRHLEMGEEALPPVDNDLVGAAVSLRPSVGETLSALARTGGRAGMTGSGAACFALFADAESAERALDALRRELPDAWVRHTRTRPRMRGR